MLGLLFALLLQPITPMAKHWYETSTPVVEMIGSVVERTDEFVLIHITGKKLRACEYMHMSAFTKSDEGYLRDAFLDRIGKPIVGATKPVGLYDLGLWKVWPLEGGTHASVFVQHDCGGEPVLSKIADVSLLEKKQ